MPKNNVISVTDMTQKAYDCILQENYAKKTCQQYWYCGVVPIRRYCEQRGIKVYSPEKINDCVTWFRGEYERGAVYPVKFQDVRKIAAVMERIAQGESYQWQALTPWYIANLPAPYRTLLEEYAEQRRRDGYKATTIRSAKPIVKHFLMYAVSLGYESVQNITLADIISYIPKLTENYQRVGDALSILRGFGTYLYERGLTPYHLGSSFSLKVPSRKNYMLGLHRKKPQQSSSVLIASPYVGNGTTPF